MSSAPRADDAQKLVIEEAEAVGLELSTVAAAKTDPSAMPKRTVPSDADGNPKAQLSGISPTLKATSSRDRSAGFRATTTRPPPMVTIKSSWQSASPTGQATWYTCCPCWSGSNPTQVNCRMPSLQMPATGAPPT
jgi:hypothetical protein